MSDLNLPPNAFHKMDMSDDAAFYAEARLVTHIDDAAIAALTRFYRERLPAGGTILDLMSSWVSHLPDDVTFGEAIGHGMNAEELAANPRLSRYFVQDLNRNTALPFETESLDAVLICVSIQYLQHPIGVLAECLRVLKPGGQIVISFSNRCFPTKAVVIWQSLGNEDHARLVSMYLHWAGFEAVSPYLLVEGVDSDPMIAVCGRKG